MSEHPTIEFIFDKVSKDEVIFPRGDILSDELPLESDLRFVSLMGSIKKFNPPLMDVFRANS